MRKTPAIGGAFTSTRTLTVSKHRNPRKSGKTALVTTTNDPVSTEKSDPVTCIINRILHDVELHDIQAVVALLSKGHTLPYIARYRAKDIGNVSEQDLRDIEMNYEPSVRLAKAKDKAQEKLLELTDTEMSELIMAEIDNALTQKEVSDVIMKYVSKEKSVKQLLMETASSDGEALLTSRAILGCWRNDCEDLFQFMGNLEHVETLISSAIYSRLDCMEVARRVLRRACSDQLSIKAHHWLALRREGKANSKYFQIENSAFLELIIQIFRVLSPHDAKVKELTPKFVPGRYSCIECVVKSIRISALDFIVPSIRREWVTELTKRSELEALEYFSSGLRSKLLQPGINVDGIVFGIDPGLTSGCKVMVLDPVKDRVLETFKVNSVLNTINKESFLTFYKRYTPKLIVLGDGTGSLEMKRFLATVVPDTDLCLVSESGASRYSVSELSMKEFPNLAIEFRGCVSIARRALDPLSEYAKIEPQHLSVGMYQHDIPKKLLCKYLGEVVSECVAQVGVDLNTASETILALVPGLNRTTASAIVEYRKTQLCKQGFRNRFELKNVKGIGPVTFSNCAGFLLVKNSDLTPLDHTAVHPNDYALANAVVRKHSEFSHLFSPKLDLVHAPIPDHIETDILRLLTLCDPRENAEPIRVRHARFFPPSECFESQDARERALEGTVVTVTSFGAFIKLEEAVFNDDGLLHISQYPVGVTDPQYYRVGQKVQVKIISTERSFKNSRSGFRISLTSRV